MKTSQGVRCSESGHTASDVDMIEVVGICLRNYFSQQRFRSVDLRNFAKCTFSAAAHMAKERRHDMCT